MPESGGVSDGTRKVLTLEDLIVAIDRHEETPSNVPKVDTFHFNGERVSDWLDRVEQAIVGLADAVKFQRIMRYVLYGHNKEVQRVVNDTNDNWAKFKEGMQRKYRLGDGLLTTADLKAMNKDNFTTIGTFVQEFKKRARKVHGISEETQCAIFLGLLTASEAHEFTTPKLRDGLKGRLSWRLVPNVHLGTSLPKEAEWAESGTKMDWKCVACGTVDLVVKGSKSAAMVDTGAEMNIIREADAIRFRLDIDRSDCDSLHGASCKAVLCGTASNVFIEVGKVKARACFFVMPDVDHGIFLGGSFLSRTETVIFNKHDGTLILLLCDPACGNYEVVTCRNTGPKSIRNRPNPGSFTIKELEGERRRLRAEPGEEERVEAFSLSLLDVGKVMDLVAAHEMADPDAIQALREQGAAQAGFPKAVQDGRLEVPPVPVLVTEDEEVYYERERGLIRRMKERASAGSCRINEGNKEELIIGEPDFPLPQARALMVELMKKRHRAYAFSDEERDRLDVVKIPMIRIHTVPHEPWNLRGAQYLNPDEEKKVVDYLDGKIRTHVADYSSGSYASPWFCLIKPNGTLRWVHYLQRLNAVTVRDAGGLPNTDVLSESCAGRPIISLIDLYSGCDQFPVYLSDRPVIAMHTPRGLIHMSVAPQGWNNAVAMVQRAMIRAMQPVNPHITQRYIDDLAVKGPAVKESDEVLPRRRQRSRRQRDPEPSEARASRGGRKALARREEESEPEVEERGAYHECGLGPVEFHHFVEGGLRRSPVRTQEGAPASEGPLRELETHLDVSRWGTSPRCEERGGQAEEAPREEVPREEARDNQGERRLGEEGRHAGKDVIEVGEDTPPQTPAVGLRPGDTAGSTRQAAEGLQREEVSLPSSEKALSPERRAERRKETATVRREALALIARHLAAHALEHPDLEEPAPAELRQELCQPEKEVEAEILKRVNHRTRERAPAGETAEEKRARRRRRIEEIWQERQRLEAAGALPEQQQERQRLEAAGALPDQPPSAPAKAPEIPEMWRDFWEQKGEGLPSPTRAGFEVARKAEERLDRKIRFLAKTSFDRYLMVESDLAGKKMKKEGHGLRLETMEVEIQELRALVASQAAIIKDLRQQHRGREDKAESSRQG
ncbi:hypothetical protein CBR_g21759 [Chara braunii]|uniref:Reverse transcriptase domain-containing protein n=1 Tax=Chara braunii TaxID=69332 RepID=A0A388L1B5_CHABU|nr:hypothetical protein CBR_g21759 [Chara braunii]|eukprot:GBG76100.1 hypothetical protein CBR_g21759 [Chara braunii]